MTSTVIWDPRAVLTSVRTDREIEKPEGKLRCSGLTQQQVLCRRPIASTSWKQVEMYLSMLECRDPHSVEAQQLLEKVSKLIVCKRDHQNQAPDLLSKLQGNIAKRCPKKSRTKPEERATGHTKREPLKAKTNIPAANMASKMVSASTGPKATMPKAVLAEIGAPAVPTTPFAFGREQAQTSFHFECSIGKPASFEVYVDPQATAADASCSSMQSTRTATLKMKAVPVSREEANVKAAASEAKLESPISIQTNAPVTATSQASPKVDDEEEAYQSFVDIMHSQAALVGLSSAPIDPASDSATLQQFQRAMRLQCDLLPETPATNAETLAQFKSGMALMQMLVPTSGPKEVQNVEVVEESDSEDSTEGSSCIDWPAVVSAFRCGFSFSHS